MAVTLTAPDSMDKRSFRLAGIEHRIEFRELPKCHIQKVYQVSNNNNNLVFAPFFLLKITLPQKVCCKNKNNSFDNIKLISKLFHVILRNFM